MSVQILVNGQMKVVADVISPGVVAKIASVSYIYSGSVWLQCDGSAISRTTYSDLFAAIGTTFGSGDGVTTFNIPTQAQANRVTFSVTSNQVFSQFTSDADVIVNNSSAAYVDISNGAAGPGIRISIIEQSSQGVTLYTDAGHTRSFFLSNGIIMLEWDGTYWVLVNNSGAPFRWIHTSGSGNFLPPFSGWYDVQVLGGGGGGGGAASTNFSYGGSGGGGGYSRKRYWLTGGGTYAYVVGGGGSAGVGQTPSSGGSGGSSTFSDGTTTITAAGGGGGAPGSDTIGASGAPGGASNGDENFPGSAGFAVGNAGLMNMMGGSVFCPPNPYAIVAPNTGANGNGPGGGAQGGAGTSGGNNRNGGTGGGGLVIIEA